MRPDGTGRGTEPAKPRLFSDPPRGKKKNLKKGKGERKHATVNDYVADLYDLEDTSRHTPETGTV